MKSFCIKTNNNKIITNLLKDLETSTFENIFFIDKKFKIYENVIIHYTGTDIHTFLVILTDLITKCIINNFEPVLLKHNINYNYFYFDEIEKKIIEQNCYKYIEEDIENNLKYRKNEIWTSVLDYISNNKSMILDGFVNFRLQNYLSTLDEVVEFNVKQYVIEKEYNEFINILQMFINSKPAIYPLIHLIYTNNETILLDENKNIIDLNSDIFDGKYLSDISFSSNDYALNALLTLLPKKIELHLIGCKDEFIDTLELVFSNRLNICTDCNICKTYKILNNTNTFRDKLKE